MFKNKNKRRNITEDKRDIEYINLNKFNLEFLEFTILRLFNLIVGNFD